jgi:hypothetical protein
MGASVRALGLRVRAEGALVRFLDSNGDPLLQTEEIERLG